MKVPAYLFELRLCARGCLFVKQRFSFTTTPKPSNIHRLCFAPRSKKKITALVRTNLWEQ